MSFHAFGKINSFNSFPLSDRSFVLPTVNWHYLFIGFGGPTKKARDASASLSLMKRKGVEDLLGNLMEKGVRAKRNLETGTISIAWFYENEEESISECHFLVGFDDEEWRVVENDLKFAYSNDLLVEFHAFGGFAEQASPEMRAPTADQFELGEALLLDSPRIRIKRPE